MKFHLLTFLIISLFFFTLLQGKKYHQDYETDPNVLQSPDSSETHGKTTNKYFNFLQNLTENSLFSNKFIDNAGSGFSEKGTPPDMPDIEPKILALQEERLQNTFLRQQEAAFSNEIDRKLPNGAA